MSPDAPTASIWPVSCGENQGLRRAVGIKGRRVSGQLWINSRQKSIPFAFEGSGSASGRYVLGDGGGIDRSEEGGQRSLPIAPDSF